MFVGGVSAMETESSSGIPEWKKMLIKKKRASTNPSTDEHTRRNIDFDVNIVRNGTSEITGNLNNKFCGNKSEISPLKTVTIGNINVELRSVHTSLPSESNCDVDGADWEGGEDLRYGPGIVDRLRARFLNIGIKEQRKPVVRRFSSLENLPGSQSGPYRVNLRQSNHVKKAQSMETLTIPEQQLFGSGRRNNSRSIVKARIFSRNVSLNSANAEEKPASLFSQSFRRWEFGRTVSTSNINEDELPKPDTVKHVKKMFESSPSATDSEKTVAQRFRKISSTTTPVLCNGAVPVVKKILKQDDAKATSAKEYLNTLYTSEFEEEKDDYFEINDNSLLLADNNLSANKSCETIAQLEDSIEEISKNSPEEKIEVCEGGSIPVDLELPNKILPLEPCHNYNDLSSPEESTSISSPHSPGILESMVVASGGEKGGPTWQKPPQSTTSIVFDFRGRKDVEPHISLNPTPFGCRPAKRSTSPPRSSLTEDREEEEDWDEMDIGADLPSVSGIVFDGENVKIGRGALLEIRNKKLSIQFDDKAISTFEYPSENASPSPNEDSFNSMIAMGSAANCRLGLSNYTPHVLSSNDEFELGVSQSNHRPVVISPDKTENKDVPVLDAIIPADSEDTVGWSATETADILF